MDAWKKAHSWLVAPERPAFFRESGVAMKAGELMQCLANCLYDAEVFCLTEYGSKLPINAISPEDCDGHVLLGDRLTAESYARDYKEEDA